ncbi:uncharacterized protein BDW43DRAFT_196318 [Aspergillus alliaceus]|uniref:uncharacterized protein n=1 Tax=Petromyces alliaceus TaxID=209559 RepID=UPI0012A4BEB8|nr:uncharacterized protein BDW43DRAFT_196318 [Aspergillus alliaceus]KAB8229087.1 hypothetical protein BDW43DRAFT_196318 [Aspergillus alliaceus]
MLPQLFFFFFFDYLLLLSLGWKEEANASALSAPPLFIGVHGRSLSYETELLRRFNLPSIQGLAARPLLFFFTSLHSSLALISPMKYYIVCIWLVLRAISSGLSIHLTCP